MNNCFFAAKVSFLNEMKIIADSIMQIEEVEGFILDGHIGHSHINVPGYDGKLGFEEVVSKEFALISFAKIRHRFKYTGAGKLTEKRPEKIRKTQGKINC